MGPLLNFNLDDLSKDTSRVLQSPTSTESGPMWSFMPITVGFIKWEPQGFAHAYFSFVIILPYQLILT